MIFCHKILDFIPTNTIQHIVATNVLFAQASTKSRYDSFSMGSGIEVVEVMEAFKADPDPSKINLSVGEYMVPGKGTVLMKVTIQIIDTKHYSDGLFLK